MTANLENSAVATRLEKDSFYSKSKQGKGQRILKVLYKSALSHASKFMGKILQARLQQYKNWVPVNVYTILFLLDRPLPGCKGLSGTWSLIYPPLCFTEPKILSPLYAWDQMISLEFWAFIEEFNCPFQCHLWLVGNWTLLLYFDLLFLELWFPHLDWSRNDLPIILFPCLEIVSWLETSWAVSWAIHCIMPSW